LAFISLVLPAWLKIDSLQVYYGIIHV